MAATDRGALWSVPRESQPYHQIVRIVEFCDFDFRRTAENLRQKQYPRIIQVSREGLIGERYFLEYFIDSEWETLELHFKKLHWRNRLFVIRQICEVLPQWRTCPLSPLGLNAYSIIMVKMAGRWFPWLLPAPPLKYDSPFDLFGCDTSILSTLAPEVIRGIPSDERAQDCYALGRLALHALGSKPTRNLATDEARIEAQVCGLPVVSDLKSSEVEEFLHKNTALGEFLKIIHRYTHRELSVRPMDSTNLQTACEQAFDATEPLVLAANLKQKNELRPALQMLEWGRDQFGETVETCLLGAGICDELDNIPQALSYLDQSVILMSLKIKFEPEIFDRLRETILWRSKLRWELFQIDSTPGDIGEMLLADLEWLKNLTDDKTEKSGYHIWTAKIYRRQENLSAAAQELYEASNLEPADFDALFLYGEVLKELSCQEEAGQIKQEGQRRVDKMVANQMMEEEEAKKWREKFGSLL